MAPKQKPGRSKQDVQTPPAFLVAVKRFLKIEAFAFDLAAQRHNTAAERYYTEADDALVQPWVFDGWSYLNPPYGDISPWVRRAHEKAAAGARTAMLVPAGVGANWWRDFVHEKAWVVLLNGRLTFVGHHQPYPKDCCLLLYGPDVKPGYSVWSWQRRARKVAA